MTLRLRERSGSTIVRTTVVTGTGTGAWSQLAVTGPPASGGTSISVEVVVSLARATTAQVDDLSLQQT